MNKQEKIIVALLALVLMGSLFIANKDNKARAAYARRQALAAAGAQRNQPVESTPGATLDTASAESPDPTAIASDTATPGLAAAGMPEQTFSLSNDVAVVTLTSKGGGIKSVRLLDYDKTLNPDEGIVELDFSSAPSMSLSDLPGLGAKDHFAVTVSDDAKKATLTAVSSTGVSFNREIALTNGYDIAVSDTLVNKSDAALTLPAYKVALGSMSLSSANGADADLAVDMKFSENGKIAVTEVAKGTKGHGFAALFGSSGGGCKASTVSPAAPATASVSKQGDVYWATVRERFFLQVLTPSVPAAGIDITAVRNVAAPGGMLTIQSVSSALLHPAATLEPGASFKKGYSLFIGPRKMSELRKLGDDYTKIMRFGTWSFFCRALLDILNFLYGLIPNYGVAIILLTAMVRLLLYPVNKKNADSMRKMQEIQPLIKEVQAKYKEDPKKLQAETMRIYGENKVNPLSSCLPMLIQLPVFIALFTVLRSSVELRYAPFLWIADLSQPENLFQNVFGFGINILPIAMAATMALQSYLTPAAGDPSQQKMMMIMMPVMMLVMFYKFPAALGLYWTVSQVFAIVGMMRTRAKKKKGAEKSGDAGSADVALRETRQMRREKARNA